MTAVDNDMHTHERFLRLTFFFLGLGLAFVYFSGPTLTILFLLHFM